jgi:hypothetical protein
MNNVKKVLEDKRWHRIFWLPSHPAVYESKFATGESSIAKDQLAHDWDEWSADEQREFSKAFSLSRLPFNSNEVAILGFLMEHGDNIIAELIAPLIEQNPVVEQIEQFLIRQLTSGQFSPRIEIFKAARNHPDPLILRALLRIHLEITSRLATRSEEPRHRYLLKLEYLYCCDALLGITGQGKYKRDAEYLVHDEDSRVRRAAQRLFNPRNLS